MKKNSKAEIKTLNKKHDWNDKMDIDRLFQEVKISSSQIPRKLLGDYLFRSYDFSCNFLQAVIKTPRIVLHFNLTKLENKRF